MAGAPKGNTNGKKENRLVTDALKRVVVQNPEKLAKACMKILEQAVEGDKQAFGLIADRLDGKPTNTIAGDSENPITFQEIVRKIVDTGNQDS